MLAKLLKNIISPALILALLLGMTGCGAKKEAAAQPGESEQSQTVQPTMQTASVQPESFTMLYDSESSCNPYTTDSDNNLLLTQLMYEGLFVLSGSFEPENALCQEYSTGDGMEYDFKLLPGVKFSDGAELTADDAAYSIAVAKDSDRYAGRLSCIDECYATDSQTLHVKLNEANYLLPSLLDVPIVEYETGYDSVPIGTGAYVLSEGELVPAQTYRGKAAQKHISLIALTTSYAEAFSTGQLDLIRDEVCGDEDIVFSGNFEMHYYDTTVMDYIGFNTYNYFLSIDEIRSGIAALVDRDAIVQQIFMGHAVASDTVISPRSWLYDSAWSGDAKAGPELISRAMSALSMADSDHDGVLETPEGRAFSIDFIVNSENPYKVRAAQRIMTELQRLGIGVKLRKLDWKDYVDALESGDFDMYYAQVRLTADFDVSELVGYMGRHNYGDYYNDEYDELIRAYLAAPEGAARAAAAKAMCDRIRETDPIVPILFRQHAAVLRRTG